MECLVLRADWEDRGKRLENVVRQLAEVRRQADLQIKAIEQECNQKTYAAESRHHDQFDRAIDKIQVLIKSALVCETFTNYKKIIFRNWRRNCLSKQM